MDPDITVGDYWPHPDLVLEGGYPRLESIGECYVQVILGRAKILQADPMIYLSELAIADLDPQLGSVGDGILTIHGIDGDVSYGLSHYDPFRRQWLGTRADWIHARI